MSTTSSDVRFMFCPNLDHIPFPAVLSEHKAELGQLLPQAGIFPPDDYPIPLSAPLLDGTSRTEWDLKCWRSAQILKRNAHQNRIKWPKAPVDWRPTLTPEEKASLEENAPFEGTRIDLRLKLCQGAWDEQVVHKQNPICIDLTAEIPFQMTTIRRFGRPTTTSPKGPKFFDMYVRGFDRHWHPTGQPDKKLIDRQREWISKYRNLLLHVHFDSRGTFAVRTPSTFRSSELSMTWPTVASNGRAQRILNRLAYSFDYLYREHPWFFNIPTQRLFVDYLRFCVSDTPFHYSSTKQLPCIRPGECTDTMCSVRNELGTEYQLECRHFVVAYHISAVCKESPEGENYDVRVTLRDLNWTYDPCTSCVPSKDAVLAHPLMKLFYQDT